MVETAIATDDPATVATVVGVAKRTSPDNADQIDAMASDYYTRVSARKEAQARDVEARTAAAVPASRWLGSLEVGGSRSTGNSQVLDIHTGLDLTRTGVRWTHKITAQADYQQTSGRSSTERALAAYQPRLELAEAFYGYGLGQYEHDRFLGFRSRYTAGLGVGLSAVERPDLKIDFDAGPAARVTDFYVDGTENRVAARGSFHLKWLPSPRLTFTQDAALYFQKDDTTAKSTTAVETRLFGPLRARLSYDVQYERDAPAGQQNLDTTSRVSLVYTFQDGAR
ncbi:MAG: hypothetical protein JWO33_1580 [Caulobacteraceae bacterium]|nr:hypothetical protein [Caulobacteraceae bacterium]